MVDQFAPDLLLRIERRNGVPVRAQLERELRDAIRSGRLHADAPLPSTRALARQLAVSRGVVVDAYSQLAAEGYLTARQGARTRVARLPRADRGASPDVAAARPPRFDLRPQVPDLSSFPRGRWLAAARRAAETVGFEELGYPDGRGAARLRDELASYLGRSRGVVTDPAGTIVTSGIMQAIGLVAAVLRDRGVRRIAVEDPGFPLHRLLLERGGLECVPLPVDEHGLRTDALPGAGAAAALVTPAHQAPLGAVLAPERRASILRWAADTGGVVIEDDYDGEYRYDREPIGALQGLAPDRVVYLGSTSKTLAPALRLAWAVAPRDLSDALADARLWADGGSPTIDQLALAEFISRGDLDRHLRRMRPRYRRRRDLLVDAVARHLPGAAITGIAAGLHAVAELPQPLDEGALMGAAFARGAAVYALRVEHPAPRSIVLLGYANLPDAAIEPAVRELAAACREL